MQFPKFLSYSKKLIDNFLQLLANSFLCSSEKLCIAVKYSLLNKGKRIRPALVYALAKLLGINLTKLNSVAASIELIHCYSLVHDDLPSIDNDDWRRGQLSCHKAFDEGTAILAGDLLQSLAFRILADPEFNQFSGSTRSEMILKLADLSGVFGMVRGQARDLANENKKINLTDLESIHRDKIGALINSCIELVMLAYKNHQKFDIASFEDLKKQLLAYSDHLGMIFQIKDDILDVEQPSEILGKPNRSDQKLNKATFVRVLGLSGAKEQLQMHYSFSQSVLEDLIKYTHEYNFNKTGIKLLYDFVDYLKDRDN